MDWKELVNIVQTDFKKAFNKILLVKLVQTSKRFWLFGNLLTWIVDYLGQRIKQLWPKWCSIF